jgi:hypothetical protein
MPRVSALDAVPGHLRLREEDRMTIGEPLQEFVVEPLLYPAALPAAPIEPSPRQVPASDPAEVPE